VGKDTTADSISALQAEALKVLAEFTLPMTAVPGQRPNLWPKRAEAWSIANACVKEGAVKQLLVLRAHANSNSIATE
jgi:hypothetical protein